MKTARARCEIRQSVLPTMIFALCICFTVHVQALPVVLTANFDDLTEGSSYASFSDGGITFNHLTQYVPLPTSFVVEATSDSLPGFSLPNYLTFGGYSPGSGASFGPFGSATMDFPGTASFASLNACDIATPSMNTLTLEGLFNGNVVATDTVNFYGTNYQLIGRQLTVSGTFNSLQLVAAGRDNYGYIDLGIDNVSVTIVPEHIGPCFLGFALIGALFATSKSGRNADSAQRE